MRLRTLPVSLAGIIAACALTLTSRCFSLTAAILCLLFATLAQIASNFANEYYDFKAGLDAPGRDGPRRGVTEGDISPRAMKAATYGVLAAACAVGLAIAATAGWWLVGAGIIIALGVIAYSAGPFPLSRHGLGEIAVIFFFGIIPVNLTYYVMSGVLWMPDVFMTSLSIGLMGANVLIVNNYRDADADRPGLPSGNPWDVAPAPSGWMVAFYRTATRIMFGAPAFFSCLRPHRRSLRALSFYLIVSVILSVVQLLWMRGMTSMLVDGGMDPQMQQMMASTLAIHESMPLFVLKQVAFVTLQL